jgi:hypothetical protein
MNPMKFGEYDRRKVIEEIEVRHGVKLTRVRTWPKYLQDENGKSYWIFGGYEDWHGITQGMMKEEEGKGANGILVIAKKYKNRIDIFAGPLRPLIENKACLSRTKKGGYEFNIHVSTNQVIIKEVRNLVLKKLSEAHYTDEEMNLDNIIEIISKMSPVESQKLIRELQQPEEKK